ncbi:MAG: hypothetical protein ACE5WD_00915, partial [Candidatus Aminicenantia bacterium]
MENKREGIIILILVNLVIPNTKVESNIHIPIATKVTAYPNFFSFRRPKAPINKRADRMMSGAANALYTFDGTGIVEGNALPI